MTDGRWWVALVTLERRDVEQDIIRETAQGACGWMLAVAPDEQTAQNLLVRDVEHVGLRVLEIADTREVFGDDDIEEIDEHLATNFRDIEAGRRTVWGTLHCYRGEGKA